MRKRLNRMWARAKKPLNAIWRWATRPEKWRSRLVRFKATQAWAAARAAHARSRKRWKRMRFWLAKATVYRKQWRRIKRHHAETGESKYEPWMLNGHSGNIDENLKPIVAWLVVERNQAITDTYDYGGHAPSSYHYPRNNSDGQGHAVDSAGPDMAGTYNATRRKYGTDFLELFGPGPWYIKSGQVLSGQFPGHTTHQHTAVS